MKTFWLDRDRDRYTARVEAHPNGFAYALGDIAPVAFACAAWTFATPPVLDPGYVRWHRRVLAATCRRNPFDGGLMARVELVSPLPAELTTTRAWWRDRGWRGWPELFGQFVQPGDRDLARYPHLRTTLLIEAPLPLDGLPAAPEPGTAGGALAVAAARAVAVLARDLSDLIGPVLQQLDSDRATM
ncbi:hypothetical protein [Dactylosporangium matsuzakiense]|uniref:Uncharacterized protein n=1 Tax=Dactylosporangium matsuzakiense TaxID=53360 RepID=A0A9W6KVM6_9ACTN|nr:hypothetical protein [Dactylosporangium matsuzakiense]UWZ49018.1 hypothetical protein Dmats_23060 [Dactylosporangium matsuzakiense]GLL07416.1 hypothetical protein GCM10017581_091680 [Dactylosporangium matsuzakiense]